MTGPARFVDAEPFSNRMDQLTNYRPKAAPGTGFGEAFIAGESESVSNKSVARPAFSCAPANGGAWLTGPVNGMCPGRLCDPSRVELGVIQ